MGQVSSPGRARWNASRGSGAELPCVVGTLTESLTEPPRGVGSRSLGLPVNAGLQLSPGLSLELVRPGGQSL